MSTYAEPGLNDITDYDVIIDSYHTAAQNFAKSLQNNLQKG